MAATPKKKIGIEVPTSDVLVIVTSRAEYLLLAESMPIGIAIISDRVKPRSCSSSVAHIFCEIRVATEPPLKEKPRLRCKRSDNQLRYWIRIGWSRCNDLRRSSLCCSVMSGLSAVYSCTGSPASLSIVKTSNVIPKKTGMRYSDRLRTYLMIEIQAPLPSFDQIRFASLMSSVASCQCPNSPLSLKEISSNGQMRSWALLALFKRPNIPKYATLKSATINIRLRSDSSPRKCRSDSGMAVQ